LHTVEFSNNIYTPNPIDKIYPLNEYGQFMPHIHTCLMLPSRTIDDGPLPMLVLIVSHLDRASWEVIAPIVHHEENTQIRMMANSFVVPLILPPFLLGAKAIAGFKESVR
jgi:hypothetical protein